MNAHDLCLIIDNDRDYLGTWLHAARACIASGKYGWDGRAAYELASKVVPSQRHAMGSPTRLTSRFCRDIMLCTLDKIDWSEVAEHYRLKVNEGASVPEGE